MRPALHPNAKLARITQVAQHLSAAQVPTLPREQVLAPRSDEAKKAHLDGVANAIVRKEAYRMQLHQEEALHPRINLRMPLHPPAASPPATIL